MFAILQAVGDGDVSGVASDLINQAAGAGDLISRIIGLVALAIVTVLKVLGKKVPLVDTIIALALGLYQKLRGVKPKVEPAKPADQEGLAGVVEIKPEEKK